MKRISLFAALLAAALISGPASAQTSGTVADAFQVAKQAVNASVQDKVVSLYGIGTPSAIQKWYIIFYDPTVASHGRAVLVQGGQIIKTYEANGGTTYQQTLSFDSHADHQRRGPRSPRRKVTPRSTASSTTR